MIELLESERDTKVALMEEKFESLEVRVKRKLIKLEVELMTPNTKLIIERLFVEVNDLLLGKSILSTKEPQDLTREGGTDEGAGKGKIVFKEDKVEVAPSKSV